MALQFDVVDAGIVKLPQESRGRNEYPIGVERLDGALVKGETGKVADPLPPVWGEPKWSWHSLQASSVEMVEERLHLLRPGMAGTMEDPVNQGKLVHATLELHGWKYR